MLWVSQTRHWGYGGEKVNIKGGHMFGVPKSCDYAEDNGYNGGGIFKAGALSTGDRCWLTRRRQTTVTTKGAIKI